MTKSNSKLNAGFDDFLRRAVEKRELLEEESAPPVEATPRDEPAEVVRMRQDAEQNRRAAAKPSSRSARREVNESVGERTDASVGSDVELPSLRVAPVNEGRGEQLKVGGASTQEGPSAVSVSVSSASTSQACDPVSFDAPHEDEGSASSLAAPLSSSEQATKQRRMLPSGAISYHGTIEEPAVRDRDGREIRRRNFILPVELIERLEEWCARPKFPVNVFVEKAIEEALVRARAERGGRR